MGYGSVNIRMEGGGMKRLILILIALSVSGWGGVQLGGGVEAVGGGPAGVTVTLNEDFSTSVTADYDSWNGATCAITTGVFTIEDSGICHPNTDAAPIEHPTTLDQWVFFRQPSFGGGAATGVAFRVEGDGTEPTNAEENYAIRCSTNMIVRDCNTGDVCTTFYDSGIACNNTDDAYGIAVAGTGSSTEWCGWFWDTGGPTIATQDIDDWGDADFCVRVGYTSGEMALLDGYSTCSGATTCAAPSRTPVYADDAADDNVAVYRGVGGTVEILEWQAGDLGL